MKQSSWRCQQVMCHKLVPFFYGFDATRFFCFLFGALLFLRTNLWRKSGARIFSVRIVGAMWLCLKQRGADIFS
jgi:hypothetical protein